MKRFINQLFIVWLLIFVICINALGNSSEEDDLFSLSLEELMQIRIKQISLLDVPHTHAKGEFMLSYHYMQMNMKGARNGTSDISNEDILQDYMVSPDKMDMMMHMFHLMYAPSDRLTFMIMMSQVTKSMDLVMRNGMEFSTTSSGFSDIKISGLYTLFERNSGRFVGGLGLSIPTGTINATVVTPMNEQGLKLPYPMQIGSGTVDPTLALTYFVLKSNHGWGADVRNTCRLYDNESGYHFGNSFQTTAWYSKIWNDWMTTTLRTDLIQQGKIRGADTDLNPMMVYTADPNLTNGTFVHGGVGICLHPMGKVDGLRFAVEGKFPLYQNLNGPQMKHQNALKIALTYVFRKR